MEKSRRTPQSGKLWKVGEDSKGKRPTSSDHGKNLYYSSPDYENVSQNQNFEDRFSGLSPNSSYDMNEIRNSPTGKDESVLSKKPRILMNDEGINQSENQTKKISPVKSLDTTNMSTDPTNDFSDMQRTTNHSGSNSYSNSINFKKPNWNERIDESKLIKEFSYQYINEPNLTEENKEKSTSDLESLPENIVRSRKKQLGLENQEIEGKDVIMKEPLKMSHPVYYLNEAHVSTLKNSDASNKLQEKRKEISKFALGESPVTPKESVVPEVPEKHQKSVKDLLADFERKSQLAQEREALENEKIFEETPGKRCVFSDTETLLYDTSSDAEDKKDGPCVSILNSLKKSELRRNEIDELTEEEDRDEEVAAALGRRERFLNCRESGRKRDSDGSYRGKRAAKLSNPIADSSLSREIDTIVTPGYLRSTLTESVAAIENSDSTCSTPTIERIKDNLEKTLPKENLVGIVPDNVKEEENEGHYMPMTPSRRVSAPSSDKSRSNSSLHSFLFGADLEETYVEMAENSGPSAYVQLNKSSLSKIKKSCLEQDVPGYCEIVGNEPESHYDFLYRNSILREPEYMEVNTLLEILKEQDEKLKEHKDAVDKKTGKKLKDKLKQDLPPTPPRSTLPDILNSSSASQQNTKSDSSDADDESSKDLDSLDVPRHPRFSLSDTFRPASYYLGSTINDRSRNIIRLPNPNENHDSSDSDLVSPPPIPTSPPPLDDLDTSLETERSLEIRPHNVSKTKLGDKENSKKLWSSTLTTQEFETVEDSKRKKRRPVSDDILETLEESEQSFYEKSMVFSELDSIGSRNGLALDEESGDINLDQYLQELQLNNTINAQLYTKDFTENIYKSCEKEMSKNLMPKESVNKTDSSEKSLIKLKYSADDGKEKKEISHERSKSADEVQYENLQALFPPPPPELYESSNEQSDRESSLAFYRNVAFPEVPPPDNYCDVYEPPENPKVCFDPETLLHQSDETEKVAAKPGGSLENQGAPYYYSDIIKNDEASFSSSSSDKNTNSGRGHAGSNRFQQLNNQRGDVQETNNCGKRNDIGRKVNPISQNYLSQAENQGNDLDDMQKITAELRSTSAHFMGAANKSGSVDIRNIYESDTLQRRKSGGAIADEARPITPDLQNLQGVARNLYPQGLKDKSAGPNDATSSSTSGFLPVQRTRSRSLEGLLNDSGYFADSTIAEGLTNQTVSTTSNQNDSSTVLSCEGNDLWDKDVLWRENLRKVSLRHTRSLDNLDDEINWSPNSMLNSTEANPSSRKPESGRRSVDHISSPQSSSASTGRRSVDHISRKQLSRNVTYVNDVVRRNRHGELREYEQDYREGQIKGKRENDVQTVVELSDSGVLDCDDGVHYEKLIRKRPTVQEQVRERNFLDGYEWDEQRETFRRNEPEGKEVPAKQRLPSSFLEDCIHPTRPPPVNESVALEPIDREKLRQWDLMSSGTVEQEEQKKVEQQDGGKDSRLKKSEEIVSEADLGEYLTIGRPTAEAQTQELVQTLEGKTFIIDFSPTRGCFILYIYIYLKKVKFEEIQPHPIPVHKLLQKFAQFLFCTVFP